MSGESNTKPTGAKYPKREQFLAHKVIRKMTLSNAPSEMGALAFGLVCVVAMQQDAKRYKKPANYRNGQLMEIFGLSSASGLDKARKKAIAAGWLNYEPAIRSSGQYWATIPDDLKSLPDVVSDDDAGEHDTDPSYHHSDRNGEGSEKDEGRLREGSASPYIPNPNPTPEPKEKGASVSPSDSQKSKKKFSEEDMETAKHIWDRIQTMNPNHKKPNLESWANDCRLMREQDNRGSPEARLLFDWANAHEFWKPNILSPAKLRKHFDKLEIQKANDEKPKKNGSGYVSPARFRKGETDFMQSGNA